MKRHPNSLKAIVLGLTATAGGLFYSASAMATTTTNTTQSPLAPLVVSQTSSGSGPGSTTSYVTRAQQFRLTMGTVGLDRVDFVEAYLTNGSDPSPLRIGIYGNTTQSNSSGGVTELYNVPNLSDQKIIFTPPNVTSISDGFDNFWTARFASVGGNLSDVSLPASDDPYWIVYMLSQDGSFNLNGVASQSNINATYFGDSASLIYSTDGTLAPPTPWVVGNRAVSASITYEAVPEPSAFALTAAGVMVAGIFAKRRQVATIAA
jgi:hypothetical protein